MPDNDDDIPVLTEPLGQPPSRESVSQDDLEQLEARLCALSLKLANELLHDACREAEHVLKERVLQRLQAELPQIISHTVHDHFKQ